MRSHLSCTEPSSRSEHNKSFSKIIPIYENTQIPGNTGISEGFVEVDGYRYVNIVVEYEQKAAEEAPLSLGVVFAHDAKGKLGSRRYFTFD